MHPSPEQLKELQDSIWKEKVLRARKMTESERFTATLEQIDVAFQVMLSGVKHQFPEATEPEARQILAERLDRLRSLDDRGLFIPAPLAN
jgi:hypothetical protein